MPRLTEYLLKLATDSGELARYKAIKKDPEAKTKLHEYLTQSPGPGLSAEHVEALHSNDTRRIVEAVHAELADESSRPNNPFYGIAVTIMCEVNNIETRYSTTK
jgi:hypothetical protein